MQIADKFVQITSAEPISTSRITWLEVLTWSLDLKWCRTSVASPGNAANHERMAHLLGRNNSPTVYGPSLDKKRNRSQPHFWSQTWEKKNHFVDRRNVSENILNSMQTSSFFAENGKEKQVQDVIFYFCLVK